MYLEEWLGDTPAVIPYDFLTLFYCSRKSRFTPFFFNLLCNPFGTLGVKFGDVRTVWIIIFTTGNHIAPMY